MSKTYIVETDDETQLIVEIGVNSTGAALIATNPVSFLTPYEERAIGNCPDVVVCTQEAYQRGLDDAWDAAKKIVLSTEDGGLFDYDVRKAVFGCGNYMTLKRYSASEAIEKIRQYEQEQEEIKVGNEVNGKGGKGIITKISNDGDHFNIMWENGSTGYYMIEDFKKTGRHFPEIAEVLKKMSIGG